MIALWLACSPSPLEQHLRRAPLAEELKVMEQVRTYLVVHPDRIVVAGRGMAASSSVPLVRGKTEERRGQLITKLYELLLERAESLKEGPEEFKGEIVLFVDLRCRDSTIREVMFTAGQAQFGTFKVLPIGPRLTGPPPPPDRVGPAGDPSFRPDPAGSVRVGTVRGEPRYLVDDRPARIAVDTVRTEPSIVVSGKEVMQSFYTVPDDPVLYRSYTEAAEDARFPVLPSVEMLVHLSKHLDDQLIGTLQKAREPRMAAWVEQAAGVADAETRAWLQIGAALGRGETPAGAASFLADATQSRPLGIYGEDEALGRIFQRDRWIAQDLKLAPDTLRAGLIAAMADPEVQRGAQEERTFRSTWTNPAQHAPLEDGGHSLFPGARSHEALWMESQSEQPAHMMEAWIADLRTDAATLDRSPDSGWYDHQQWALEPLLTLPDDLEVGPGYRKRLEDAFKSSVAMRRETQVKDLFLPAIGSGSSETLQADIAPHLRVEPVPTHFARSAEVYAWLRSGPLQRGDLPDAETWDARLAEIETLYTGLAAISRADLGIVSGAPLSMPALSEGRGSKGSMGFGEPEPPAPTPPSVPAEKNVAAALDWLQTWRDDPVLSTDVRLMVPAGKKGKELVVWVLLGVRSKEIIASYAEPPIAVGLGGEEVVVKLREARYTVLMPYFSELTVKAPLDRAALRALGDRYPSAKGFREALSR